MSGSAHASGGCGYYGGATGGEDLRARHDRDRDPPAHAIGARYTRSVTPQAQPMAQPAG